MTVLVSVDEHSPFQGWFVCFPAQSPRHVETAIFLRFQTECHRGTGEDGESAQPAGIHRTARMLLSTSRVSGENYELGDS